MQIAIVDDRAEDRAELSACLENYMKKHQLDYGHLYGEHGWNRDRQKAAPEKQAL